MAKLIFLLGSKISRVPRHHNDHWWVGLSPAPRRGAQLWPGLAARELTRYPVARLRMINTSLVGGCFSHPPDYVMALSANLERQRWCDPGYCRRGLLQFWLAAAADVAVATRHTAGVLWSWALGPACVRQVSSVLAIGWWGASMAWHAACTWRLLFFRPSTAAASLPRLNTFFTGYHWFTSMRDGRGPVTELSADGARPSVNVPTPWREATSAVAEVWFGDACALYLVQHVGGSVAHTDHDLAFGYVSSAYGARTLPPATHSSGPRLWQHTSTHTHTRSFPCRGFGACSRSTKPFPCHGVNIFMDCSFVHPLVCCSRAMLVLMSLWRWPKQLQSWMPAVPKQLTKKIGWWFIHSLRICQEALILWTASCGIRFAVLWRLPIFTTRALSRPWWRIWLQETPHLDPPPLPDPPLCRHFSPV